MPNVQPALSPWPAGALLWTLAFALALVASTLLQAWLASRQIRHVARHRGAVPADFAQRVALSEHERAAAYTIERTRLALLDGWIASAVLLGLTLLGGIQSLWELSAQLLPSDALLARQCFVLVAVALVGGIVELPLDAWRRFHIEERFGFNRLTVRLWIVDGLRHLLLSLGLGLPLAALVLSLIEWSGPLWWLWAWLVWITFSFAMMILFPIFFARLFNRFEPLPPGPLRERLEQLLERCGFPCGGLFVMDGSRRSAHGNAYFTGFGKARRIVLFDTLIEQLDPAALEAVLAHEIGHFRLRHIPQRLVLLQAMSLAALALIGWLATQGWFYQGLGVVPAEGLLPGLALLLFLLVSPIFNSFLGPILARLSRQQEFEADAYAVKMTSAQALSAALVALYRNNASTLTPDPLHSAFHDSHPPASLRIRQLAGAAAHNATVAVNP